VLAERAFLHMGGAFGEHALPKPKPRPLGGAFGEHALPLVCWVARSANTPYQNQNPVCWVGRGVNRPYLMCGAFGEHALPTPVRWVVRG